MKLNMKKLAIICLFLIAGIASAQTKITKTLSDFSELKVFNGIEVELIKSDKQEVEITGEKAEKVKIKNSGNTLKFSLKFPETSAKGKVQIKLFYNKEIAIIDANEGAVITGKEISQQKIFVEALEYQVSQKTASLSEKTIALEVANSELEQLTYTDALSGLYNRRYFDRNLLLEITRHKRQKEPLALVICDIDYFKLYNDQYGHIGGDSCIQQVSACMRDIIHRSSDSICRYGGEEFALILPNSNEGDAIKVVEKLMKGLSALKIKHETSPVDDFVTMSYGIYSLIPKAESTPESMIVCADKALYASKDSGRNCFTVAGLESEASNVF